MTEVTTKIDASAKIWQPTTIVKAGHRIFIGPECRIGQHCFIAPKELIMERGAQISPLAVLGGGGSIYMCKYSTVNYGAKLIPATFTTKGKYMNDAIMATNPEQVDTLRGNIRLEEGAVVGANAVVCVSKRCPNITIGKFAVVGANSYLDCSIGEGVIVRPNLPDCVRMR